MSKTLSQKVPFVEKLGYSLGDCSANLVFQMMMIYQAKFYTDVFGLEGSITLFACIGLVFFVITFLTSHERIAPPPSQKDRHQERHCRCHQERALEGDVHPDPLCLHHIGYVG